MFVLLMVQVFLVLQSVHIVLIQEILDSVLMEILSSIGLIQDLCVMLEEVQRFVSRRESRFLDDHVLWM
jgi:hypothetical protein